MTPEEIEALEKAVVDLRHERDDARHQLENMTLMRDSLQAQLQEIRERTGPIAKNHWYGYKAPKRKGAFDMLEVLWWEGSQLRENGPWNYAIRIRSCNQPLVMDQAEFDKFAPVFDAYISRE